MEMSEKSLYLICLFELVENNIDYRYVKIFRQAQYDTIFYFSDLFANLKMTVFSTLDSHYI